MKEEDFKATLIKIIREKEGVFDLGELLHQHADNAVETHMQDWARLVSDQTKKKFLNEPNTPDMPAESIMINIDGVQIYK